MNNAPPSPTRPSRISKTALVIIGTISLALIAIGCCCFIPRSKDRPKDNVSSSTRHPNPVVRTEVRDNLGPLVQDPEPAIAFQGPAQQSPDAAQVSSPAPRYQAPPLVVTNQVTITNTVVQWMTNTIFVTNPPVVYRQTNNRVETQFVYTNSPAASPVDTAKVQVNIPPGTQFQPGSTFQVSGRDGYIGWNPGVATNGQQVVNGAIPGSAGYLQKVTPDQKGFALNAGEIAVIDFPSGLKSWKLTLPPTQVAQARVLFDGLPLEEKKLYSGISDTRRVTVQNTGDQVLLARTEQ